ncbi:MAG: sigma-70 family polymerase sigma factor [Bacteroidetes bacterium]|nr:sigma-70 family polymerase sigma factor [Bacteroidota bacterium]
METLDKDLLEGILKKDESSFKELYDKYSGITLRQISSRVADTDTAKDLLQDFWLFVWTSANLVRTDDKGNASKSLFFILSKRILDYYRHVAKSITENVDDMEKIADQNLQYSHVMENIIGKEIDLLIDQLMSQMPELDQLIFKFRIKKQFSIKETAAELSISEKTVQNRMTKISSELREKLTSANVSQDIIYSVLILLHLHS